jgi:hydroxymethylbilane synthase
MKRLTIGTRGSALALAQTHWVKERLLQHYPECRIKVLSIKTTGDQMSTVPISEMGGKGVFIKEIEKALLDEEIDCAVHSMKDLPMELPHGLVITAIPFREDPSDVFISETYSGLDDLPPDATVATGSLRRKVQILHYRNDLVIKEIRGNVDTRLAKLNSGFAEGLVLAAAGLKRLNRASRISQYLNFDICLPAAGQGALGIEVREKDATLRKELTLLNDPASYSTVTAERNCLHHLGVDCHTPVTAFGEIKANTLLLKGLVASLDGSKIIKKTVQGPPEETERLGKLLATQILQGGGKELLDHLSGNQ